MKTKFHIEDCKGKSFHGFRINGFHLNFSNGNSISTIWGTGTYTENYDLDLDKHFIDQFNEPLTSDTVEIMFSCPKKLKDKILDKYNEGKQDPIGHLPIGEWLEIIGLLSK